MDIANPSTTNNQVYDNYGTIGGGANNRVGSNDSNTTSAQFATVGGGRINTASSQAATVAGGWVNVASANAATVPGGANNTASGAYSFAAGAAANATHDGSFVWSATESTSSWGAGTFTVRAQGGARFYTASGTSTGVQLASGDGSWASLSDKNTKFNITPVDTRRVLEKLAALPVSTWSYKSQDASIVHMGPMAQDFSAAFGLGEDERYIGSLDTDGVALAAIQGLYKLNQEQAAEIQALKAELREVKPGDSNISPIWIVAGVLLMIQAGMFYFLSRKARGAS
jgi:hypothetical protein